MPQFDIFSFFSQLFWVFFGFITLYLIFSFSLLPALAAILKIRKRKLASQNNSNHDIIVSDTINYESTNSIISSLTSKINSFDNSFDPSNKLTNGLNILTLQAETSNRLNITVLSQAQLTALFYR